MIRQWQMGWWTLMLGCATAGQGMPGLWSVLDQLTGQVAAVESVTPRLQQEILQQFLDPQPRPLVDAQHNYLPVVGLLVHHLKETQNVTSQLHNTFERFSRLSYTPFTHKSFCEYRGNMASLRMGPQTSFYFYLAMLAFVRDVQVEDDVRSSVEFPFSPQHPFSLREALKPWSIASSSSYIDEGDSLEATTFYADLREHRQAYFELLAYRFLTKNQRLDGWGPYYLSEGPKGQRNRRLGDSSDTLKKIRAELSRYREGFVGCPTFAQRVAALTKTSLEQLLPARAAAPQTPPDSPVVKVQRDSPDSVFHDFAEDGLRQRVAH